MNDLIINIDGPTSFVISDTIVLNGKINTDLTEYKIRCEISDNNSHAVKLATLNSGGSDDEINVTDAENGLFTITCAKDLTIDFDYKSFITIEVENASGQVRSLYSAGFLFNKDRLTWTTSE